MTEEVVKPLEATDWIFENVSGHITKEDLDL